MLEIYDIIKNSAIQQKIVKVEKESKITDFIKCVESKHYSRKQQRYIITGGPGAGKTSIIQYLEKQKYVVVPEAATHIIEEGLKKGIEKPWQAEDYHIKVNELNIKHQSDVQKLFAPIIFFDRGHLDSISYILLQKRTLYQYVIDCVQASEDTNFFNKTIFFIDNLNFVIPGPARTESLEESLQKAHCLEQNYRLLGYKIVHIPGGEVEKRAQLIIDYVNDEQDKTNGDFK